MVTLPLAQRHWILALLAMGPALGACGGTDAPDSSDDPQLQADTFPLNPCRVDLDAAGYAFDSPPDYPGDFEDGRSVGFYVSVDGSEGSVVTSRADSPIDPPGSDRVIPTSLEDGRPCVHADGTEAVEGEFALRIQGTGLTNWGISMTQDFFSADYDASEWDGISFWVRRGDGVPGRTMFAGVMEWHTKEFVWNPATTPEPPVGFFCGDLDGEYAHLKCDGFGVGVGLDETWRHVRIPFSDMQQQGFGSPAPCLFTQALMGLKFTFAAGDWDVWLDDIAFYRAPDGDRPPAVVCDDAPPEP